MAVTFLYSAVAAIVYIPVAVLLFLVLDRYAEPRVPKSLFDERKVMLTFVVGIALGLILSVIFVFYTSSLASNPPAWGGAIIYAILFLVVAALIRRVLVRTKTFGGIGSSDPLLPVHTFSFGAVSGATIALGLGLDLFGTSVANVPYDLGILTLISLDLMLVEAWAGLRFGRLVRRGFSWLPPASILAVEALTLLAIAPVFAGAAYAGDAALGVLLVASILAVHREEPRALKALRRAVGVDAEVRAGRFGRGTVDPASPLASGEEGTAAEADAPTDPPLDPSPKPPST